jgi:hypothetical protein
MNFLCILQVSRIVFVLKTNFCNYFSIFNPFWTGPRFLVNSGTSVLKILRHRVQGYGPRVQNPKPEGFMCKLARLKWFGRISAVRSTRDG